MSNPLQITSEQIQEMWSNQNPAVLRHLRESGGLASRLKDALASATMVAEGAVSRGESQGSALEQAMDSVALQPPASEMDDE